MKSPLEWLLNFGNIGAAVAYKHLYLTALDALSEGWITEIKFRTIRAYLLSINLTRGRSSTCKLSPLEVKITLSISSLL